MSQNRRDSLVAAASANRFSKCFRRSDAVPELDAVYSLADCNGNITGEGGQWTHTHIHSKQHHTTGARGGLPSARLAVRAHSAADVNGRLKPPKPTTSDLFHTSTQAHTHTHTHTRMHMHMHM